MARDMTPIVKQSRREKVALHPKAIKGLTKKPYGPGEHGQSGMRSKLSQYAVQLREKQKVKRSYGLLEKQFVKLVKEAEKAGYVTTQKDPNDQRAVIVKITQKSLDMGTKVYDISDKMMEQLKAEIGEERMKAFFETMRDINRHYEGNLKSASDKE